MEKQIKNKRFVLEQLLNNLPAKITKENKNQTKEILNEIKLVVGYLKRKASLILFAEQKNEISKDEVRKSLCRELLLSNAPSSNGEAYSIPNVMD